MSACFWNSFWYFDRSEAHLVIISSIDLFFSRDCAGGGGPAVDAPRFIFAVPVPSAVAVLAGCVGACEMSDGAVDFANLSNKLDVGAGADVDTAEVLVVSDMETGALSCAFPMLGNRLLEGALVEGAGAPEILGGLLKKPKAFGAAVGEDTGFVAED